MKLVYTTPKDFEISVLRMELESCGIECFVDNEKLRSLAGELTYADVWKKLYVNEADFEEAQKMATTWRLAREQVSTDLDPWECRHCGEMVEGNFSACWNCEKPHNV